jgi:diaminohydroxyphosphoribosylaminopyrimidine deaminase/5-amino-6-(5-phosphoribosylamino)uracil reductase
VDSQDRKFMRRALALAEKSAGMASPNPPVGCVIVREGRILGQGWHEYQSRDHAEAKALAGAQTGVRGATAYVTLEPCVHYGRTPPCTSSLIAAGVRRVVIGHGDPNPLVAGKGISALQSAGIEVEVGVLQLDAGRLIEPFACHITTGMPLVVSKVGMSLDGRIATAGNRSDRITSEESREFSQRLRLQLDALLVGVGTVVVDDPQLSYRGKLPKARPLIVAVLDSHLRTPPTARIFLEQQEGRILIYCRTDAPIRRRQELEARGAGIIPVAHGPQGLDLNQVLRDLAGRDILSVLVEGGSKVHWSFVSANLVDKFYFFVAPVILGGNCAVPAVGGEGYASVEAAPAFKISREFRAGSDLILETYPSSSRSILSPWLGSPLIRR